MSRWKPANPASSAYITAAGYAQLKAEYEQLWRIRRPDVVRALSAAAAEGDRSENAEYQYRKKELREIDRRVRYLQQRLPALKVVGSPPGQSDRVYFGAWVELEDASGHGCRYRIVGPDEADAAKGTISLDSPLARAVLGRAEGDLIRVILPDGIASYDLVSIHYE